MSQLDADANCAVDAKEWKNGVGALLRNGIGTWTGASAVPSCGRRNAGSHLPNVNAIPFVKSNPNGPFVGLCTAWTTAVIPMNTGAFASGAL